MTTPGRSDEYALWVERQWAELPARLVRLEQRVDAIRDLMGPLEKLPGAGPGEPTTAIEHLSYVIGFLHRRVDMLADRLSTLERANDP